MAPLLYLVILLSFDVLLTASAQRVVLTDLNPCFEDIPCTQLPNNVKFPYPGDCARYYTCRRGQLRIEQCLSGLLFHYPTLSCNARRNVECYPACVTKKNEIDEVTTVAEISKSTDTIRSTLQSTSGTTTVSTTPLPSDKGATGPTWGRLPTPSTTKRPQGTTFLPQGTTFLPLTPRDPISGITPVTKATTSRPVDPIERCAPPRHLCTPGDKFGYALDCGRYYECIEPTTPNGPHYAFVPCWKPQRFDIVSRSCTGETNVRCEHSCPGEPPVVKTTVAMGTVENTIILHTTTASTANELITSAMDTTLPNTDINNSSVPNSGINETDETSNVTSMATSSSTELPNTGITKPTVPDDVTSTSTVGGSISNITAVFTLSTNTKSDGGVTTARRTTTPPSLLTPEEQCAPASARCAKGELFGFAGDCKRYYECTGIVDSSEYYELKTCWNSQGFDIFNRTCVDSRIVRCETQCPGYVRTTTSVAPTTITQTTTEALFSSTPNVGQITTPDITTSIETTVTTEDLERVTNPGNTFTTAMPTSYNVSDAYDLTTTSIYPTLGEVTADVNSTLGELTTPDGVTDGLEINTTTLTGITTPTTPNDVTRTLDEELDQSTFMATTTAEFISTSEFYDNTNVSRPSLNDTTTLSATVEPPLENSTLPQYLSSTVTTRLETTEGSGEFEGTPSITLSTAEQYGTTFSINASSTNDVDVSLTTLAGATENETVAITTDLSTEELMISTQGYSHVDWSTPSQSSTPTVPIATEAVDPFQPNTTESPRTISPTTGSFNETIDGTTSDANDTMEISTENVTLPYVVTESSTEPPMVTPSENTTSPQGVDVHTSSTSVLPTTIRTEMTSTLVDRATTAGISLDATTEETTANYSTPQSTACNRREPCITGRLLAHPTDCSRYYQCVSTNSVWESRSCGTTFFDMYDEMCTDNATCAQPCDVTTMSPHTPGPTSGRTSTDESQHTTEVHITTESTVTPESTATVESTSLSDFATTVESTATVESIFTSESSSTAESTSRSESNDTLEFTSTPESTAAFESSTMADITSVSTTSTQAILPTTSEPGYIWNHELTIQSEDALAGEELVFLCSFVVAPAGTRFTVQWRLNGSVVRESGRIHIRGATRTTHTSQLTFDPVYAHDSGKLSCVIELTKYGVESEARSSFHVLGLPRTTLSPMTAVIQLDDPVTLTCNATLSHTGHPNDGADPRIRWYRDGVLVTINDTDIEYPGMSQITTSPMNDVTYSCAGYNPDVNQGEGWRSNSTVYVIEPNEPICMAETVDDVTWPNTAAGIENKQPCPGHLIGEATRECEAEGSNGAEWEEPNMIDCVNHAFIEVSQQIAQLEDGIGGPEESEKITETLQQITNTTDPLPPGDINSATESVTSLANLRWDETMRSVDLSEVEMTSMMNTVSNLISEMNEEPWDAVLKEYPDKAVSLMRTVDIYGDIFAHQLSMNETMHIVTSMLVVQVDALSKNATRDLHYPETDGWHGDDAHNDVILLHKDTLDQISQNIAGDKVSVSSCYYKSLSHLLPHHSNASDEAYIDSRVLAVSVAGHSQTHLDPPVQMSFTHNEIPDDKQAICSYWDYDENMWSTEGCHVIKFNSTQTTCECDHLTNFAILVSKKPLTGTHAYVLGIISIVGCVISIAGLALTILIYVSIWKHVKSHHAVVLINLCIALLVANLIFVTGVDKSEHEDLCTAIAALLHYFYLAAFCIMLVEGIQLVMYIIYVFHVRRKRETAFMLLLAWVFPAAVVGICLGISKTEGYGTEDYCWLNSDSWVFWAFIVPALIIILINIGILVAVLKRISTSKLQQMDKTRNQRVRSGTWNILVIMPILGITWIFGIFSVNSDIVAFQYIFAIANSLQGLFIFIFHAICNKKKGNYKVKTTSQRTQRSRLKSDSTEKKGSKTDTKPKKGFMTKSNKTRNPSTENPYDTIPAEYVMDTIRQKGAVENEYMLPNDNNRPSSFDTFILPEDKKEKTFSTFQQSNGINRNPFDTYIVPEETKNGLYHTYDIPDETKRESVESNYMVPVSKLDSNGGFANPAFDHFTDHDDVSISLNNDKNVQDTTLSTPSANGVGQYNAAVKYGVGQYNAPVQYGGNTPQRSNTPSQFNNTPPPYNASMHSGVEHTQSDPPHTQPEGNYDYSPSLPRNFKHSDFNSSLHSDLRQGDSSSLASDSKHTDSGSSSTQRRLPRTDFDSSLQRGLIRNDLEASLQRRLAQKSATATLERERKAEQLRPDEFMDYNLRKQESPRHTPRTSPYLPRSTPFLSKQDQL